MWARAKFCGLGATYDQDISRACEFESYTLVGYFSQLFAVKLLCLQRPKMNIKGCEWPCLRSCKSVIPFMQLVKGLGPIDFFFPKHVSTYFNWFQFFVPSSYVGSNRLLYDSFRSNSDQTLLEWQKYFQFSIWFHHIRVMKFKLRTSTMVMAKLAERSTVIPEVDSSYPVIGKFYTKELLTVNCIEKWK